MSRVSDHSTKTFPEKKAEQNILNRSSTMLSESSKELKKLFRSFDRVHFWTVTKNESPNKNTSCHHAQNVLYGKNHNKGTKFAMVWLFVGHATNCALCGIVELQGPADSFRISDNILHKVIC